MSMNNSDSITFPVAPFLQTHGTLFFFSLISLLWAGAPTIANIGQTVHNCIESSMWFREVLNLLPVSGFATSVCKTTRVCNIFREIRFGWKSLVRVGKTSEWGGNLLSDVIVARLKQRRPVLQKQRTEEQYSGTIYISYS